MKRAVLLAALALPALSASQPPTSAVTLRIVSATGDPVAIAGTVIGHVESAGNPVARLGGTTPYEMDVLPGDFAAAFWQSGDGPGLVVEVVEAADTTRFWSEPAHEHVLVDRRAGSFHIAGSAMSR